MHLLRTSSLISAAALIGLSSACTWITTPVYLDKLDCVDLDGDGATQGECEEDTSLMLDCNDSPDQGGAMESPLSSPEIDDPTLWYDGFDNDCSFDGSGTEHDVLDADGDGFPGITFDNWVVNGVSKEWPPNLSKDAGALDCDDTVATIFPDASDEAYDGIDSNCDGLDDFDSDGDGFIPNEHATAYAGFEGAPWHTALPAGDCDDSRADVFPNNTDPADEFYDGVDHDCAGNNDFDADNDGYIPRQYLNQCNAYNLKYDYSVACNAGIDEATHPDGDCDEANININPGANDGWYDGIDQDCTGNDDFDADRDGFIPDAWESVYATYASQDWWLNLEIGDCNDTDETVRPGELEVLGDDFDQDCDGDIDTTTFAHGGYTYLNPRAPVLDANDHHYLLGVAGAMISRPAPADARRHAGVALAFPFDVGFEPEPENEIEWQILNTEPLAEAIDLYGVGDRFYVAFSYQKLQGSNINNWLFIREHITTNDGANYAQYLVYSKQQVDPVLQDIDLRVDDEDVFWVAACGDGVVHFRSAKVQSERLTQRKDGVLCEDGTSIATLSGGIPLCAETYDIGGDSCYIEFSGDEAYLHSYGDTEGVHTYLMDEGAETISEDASSPWSPIGDFAQINAINTRPDTEVFAVDSDGVEVIVNGTSYEQLTSGTTETGGGYTVLDADAVVYDGMVFIAAITTDNGTDGLNDVVIAYGDVGASTLEDVIVPYAGPDELGEQDPTYVTLYVDADRIGVAVAAYGTTRPPNSADPDDCIGTVDVVPEVDANTCQADSVGWIFMGSPE